MKTILIIKDYNMANTAENTELIETIKELESYDIPYIQENHDDTYVTILFEI